MNKKLFKTLFLIALINICPLLADFSSTIDVKGAAFYPISSRFRHVYSDIMGSYQIEAATKIYAPLDGWINFDWVGKHGRSIDLQDRTKVNIINSSLGIKYPYKVATYLTFYIGIGPSLAKIWVKNYPHCGQKSESKWAVGGVIKSGMHCYITSHFFIDLFLDYLYQPVNFKDHVDIGGFKEGGGIGFAF